MNRKNLARYSVILFLITIGLPYHIFAQEMPPRPISVGLVRSMSFGAFAPGNTGGTITLNAFGGRSATGDVFLVSLGYPFYEAVFEVEGNIGTLVSEMNGDDIVLTGNNGGTLLLHLGEIFPISPFILTGNSPDKTQFHVGGTLTVGNILSNPAGQYNGVFYVTFIQE